MITILICIVPVRPSGEDNHPSSEVLLQGQDPPKQDNHYPIRSTRTDGPARQVALSYCSSRCENFYVVCVKKCKSWTNGCNDDWIVRRFNA